MKKFTLKTLLASALLCVGSMSAWADVINATLEHTASSSRDKNNAITTTVDQEFEHYNNTKAAAWGGWAYAQFSYTIPDGYSITSATLTWNTKIGGNANTRNNDIYYVNAGTTIDYASLTSTSNLNLTGTFIVNEALAGPTTRTQVVTDVTTAFRTIAATQNFIIFKWTNNGAGADLYGKGSTDYAPTLTITCTNATLYTATFTANEGTVSPTITIYSDEDRTVEVANGSLADETTYYFKASAVGYNDYIGQFTVAASDPSVNFGMTALPRYTFAVNAINSADGSIIKSFISDSDSYDGKAFSSYFPKYITDASNAVTFSKDNTTYYANYTSASDDATKTVSYTAYSGTAYFFEAEDEITGTTVENGALSGGYAKRAFAANSTLATVPETGLYNITYAVANNSYGNAVTITLYRNSTQLDQRTDLTYVTTTYVQATSGDKYGTKTLSNIMLSKDDAINITSSNNNGFVDYILLEKVADIVDANNEFIGSFDCSTAFLGALNATPICINAGETVKYSFVNHNSGSGNIWDNWYLVAKATADANENILDIRADQYTDGEVTQTNTLGGFNYISDYNGATVDLEIALTDAGDGTYTFSSIATITKADGSAVSGSKVDQKTGLTQSTLYLYVSVQNSWLELLTEAVKKDLSIGYATYYSNNALDFSGSGLTASLVTGAEGNMLTKADVSDVPAETPILLSGENGTYIIPVVASSNTKVAANKLQGVHTATVKDANSIYVLMNEDKGVGFYSNSNAFTVGANTAYLPIDFADSSAKVRFFSFADEASGIETVGAEATEDGAIYNLSGQQVNAAYKGIVIKNGKKYLNK